MKDIDLATLMSRSTVFDPAAVDWDAVGHHPLPPDALRTLRYMRGVESHTVVYVRELLSTRAIDDPELACFFATWLYEETAHGLALARFLAAAGHPVVLRPRAPRRLRERIEALGIAAISAAWREFPVVHMTWGAINEITALTAYRRLAEVAGHPVLSDLLGHIMRDESRHFAFYFDQAERRLAASARARRITRALVERFWDPVGAGVHPASETRFLAAYLFASPDGRAAACTVDRTIRRLPGFADAPLLEAWVDRHCAGVQRSALSVRPQPPEVAGRRGTLNAPERAAPRRALSVWRSAFSDAACLERSALPAKGPPLGRPRDAAEVARSAERSTLNAERRGKAAPPTCPTPPADPGHSNRTSRS